MSSFSPIPNIFDSVAHSPAAWLFGAYRLRNAAAAVDWLNEENIDKVDGHDSTRLVPWRHNPDLMSSFPIYRLLMGLSFEHLLKGILVTQGEQAVTNGKLDRAFKTHKLCDLLDKVNKQHLSFSKQERELLKEITRFVEWQGRYPIPVKSADYVAGFLLNNPDEHKVEHQFWDRLRDHLALVGWKQLADGTRLKLKLEGAKVSIVGDTSK